MGHYQDFVERIKRDLTIDSLLPAGAQGKRSICCPLPGHNDKSPSFTVYRETNSWICWSHPGGRSAGSVLDYLMAERGVSFKEAVQIGADLLGIELRPPSEEEKVEIEARRQREDVLTVLAQVAHGWLLGDSATATQAREVLHSRGFTDELIKDQCLGLLDIQKLLQVRASHPHLAGFSEADFAAVGLRNERGNALFLGPRLAIPLLARQRVTGFTFRTLDPADKRKYMHLPGPAGLYNEDALHHQSREVVLAEGIPDCWTLMQWDIPALGNLGVEATKHAARFARQRRVTLVWDNDDAGRSRVLKSARAIQADMPDGEVRILHVPGVNDVNDWAQAGGSKEDFQELLKQAPDLCEYQIDLLPDVKAGDRMGAQAQSDLRGLLESVAGKAENQQALYLKKISKRIDAPIKGLRDMLKEFQVLQKEKERKAALETANQTTAGPKLIFKDTIPYVAALGFSFTDLEQVANIGVWIPVDENGEEVKHPFVVESSIKEGRPMISLVKYSARATDLRSKARFPNPDLPRWNLSASSPYSVERILKDVTTCTPNTAELFRDIRALLKEFIWYPAEHEYDIVALWIMMSYVYPIFGTVGYLHFNGISGSGKSLSLRFIHDLAFNALKTANISDSALFRTVDANRSTLLMDEAEKLSYPKAGSVEATTRSIFLDSYTAEANIYRTNMETGLVEAFDTFSPKCLGSINKIDPVFANRCIVIHSLKKQKDVRLKDSAQNIAEVKRRTAELRNRLHCWVLTTFHLINQIYTVDLNGALPDLISREREIWLSLIAIAHLVDRESEKDETQSMVDVILKAQREKESEREDEARRENLDILVLQTLLNLITGEERKTFSLLMEPSKFFANKLAEAIHTELVEEGTWPFEKKLTSNRLTSTLKTHHVIAETDISRPMEGGKRVRAILLQEQSIRIALRRLHGLDADEEDGSTPPPQDDTHPVPTGKPTQTTIHDDDPLPF